MPCTDLLPDLIDRRASKNPSGVFAKVPRNNDYSCGYRNITNACLATAVNHVVHLIITKFGRSDIHECIAYLGPSDLRYTVIVLANIKAGFKTFLPSPRNSEKAQSSLFAELKCIKLITTSPTFPGLPTNFDHLQTLMIPSLDELLDLEPEAVTQKKYGRSFEDVKQHPIFVLHTSGSTGIPKPLTYTNEFISRLYNTQTLPPPDGSVSVDKEFRKGHCLVTLPPFHIAGLAFTFLIPALFESVPVYTTAGAPLTLSGFLNALSHLSHVSLDWAFLSPVVVDAIGRDAEALEIVASRLKHLFFTGGSVPRDSGTAVAKKIMLNQVLGSSECAAIPLLRDARNWKREDWHCVNVHPDANVEFQHRFDGIYELVQIKRRDCGVDGMGDKYQPVFCHFGSLDSYATNDLFRKHPTLPNSFTYVGRIDDIIVFLNGEKTNPVTFQDEVSKHPNVRAALVVGQHREEAALIVEPVDEVGQPKETEHQFIEKVWPTIEDSNQRCPAHARVSKDRIIVARRSMPFLRTGKGTVQVKGTLALYERAIDDLYNAKPSGGENTARRPAKAALDFAEATAIVREAAFQITRHVIAEDTNVFSTGMDSRQVLLFQRTMQRNFPLVAITPEAVYSNPTIKSFTQFLVRCSTLEDRTSEENPDRLMDIVQSYEGKLDALCQNDGATPPEKSQTGVEKALEQITETLHGSPTFRGMSSPNIVPAKPQVERSVLLTGSTGALGSYILTALLEDQSRKIYCLNRSTGSEQLQKCRNEDRGLPTHFPAHRVTFLTGDLTRTNLGLSASEYSKLQNSVSLIIHNAWPVDFIRPIRSFADSLDGVCNLVKFAYLGRQRPTLQFISSITSMARYCQEASVPERDISDPNAPADTGYGQSKYVAERILARASDKLGLKTMCVRVGQICGDDVQKSGWSIDEWFPTLVISSLHMRALPDSLGNLEEGDHLRWVPINRMAKILLELSSNKSPANLSSTFHVLHPESLRWNELVSTVRRVLNEIASASGGPNVEVVTYDKWVTMLQNNLDSDPDLDSITSNPAMKLLPFYKSLLEERSLKTDFTLVKSMACSGTLRTLQPLETGCLEAWIRLWMKKTTS